MSPDDPRHGSHRGYTAGCREACCQSAHSRYMNLYRMGRKPALVDPTGTQRKIQGLMALGWSARHIGDRAGRTANWAHCILRTRRVSSATAAVIASIYDQLCMEVPQGPYAARNRLMASRSGYLPPLAWDNIDDPHESIYTTKAPEHRDDVDQDIDWAVVERVLAGEVMPQANRAERVEIVRRWEVGGRSLAALERQSGWKIERYTSAARGTLTASQDREVA